MVIIAGLEVTALSLAVKGKLSIPLRSRSRIYVNRVVTYRPYESHPDSSAQTSIPGLFLAGT